MFNKQANWFNPKITKKIRLGLTLAIEIEDDDKLGFECNVSEDKNKSNDKV